MTMPVLTKSEILAALSSLDERLRDRTTTHPLSAIFSGVSSAREFSYSVRDFLDRFREHPSSELLREEPPSLAGVLCDNGLADAYLASVAATLAHEQGWPAPAWAQGTARALATPWFAAKTPKLKAVLLQESPPEFRVRNLFVSANALSRA
jgi:hypothetical protein